jgi:hypothetical protein
MNKSIISILCLCFVAYSGEIPNRTLHPGIPDTINYQDILNTENGLKSLKISDSMLKALSSVASTRRSIDCNKNLEIIEKQFHENLTIGVMNCPKIIKGTLLAQKYNITKLEYEISILKKDKAETIDQKRKQFELAKSAFLEYWNKLILTD